ncbi:hypothetical protein [Agromyces aureus]|uniref:Uncharacterized protein n=1 Tax=Agromyces aureus TaxID=453304 RepID=A0A191WCG4_9MICO|nr:hypothetical protein [Agromyces aureus]ANJ25883.1 hypothetical protein ATC03_03115 [Agromyces aureus]
MNIDPAGTGMITALWLTVAILAGGYARTRNRSAWTWFLLTAFLGPIAAFLLVVWPARDTPSAPAGQSPSRAEISRNDAS